MLPVRVVEGTRLLVRKRMNVEVLCDEYLCGGGCCWKELMESFVVV